MLQPGQAALFMMVSATASDRVVERLAEKGGRILRTNLDRDAESRLRQEFEQAHARETAFHEEKKQ